ncbi:MAG: glycosyltransferase [Cyclobacteriaceae bacterium]|nr:glycosyltransferase [Cyclobacteriaceae bacterium]
MPFFSIIIPSYNRASFLTNTILSVLNQDFEDFELIIVDDGSTDNTKEVVEKFTDPRIIYHIKKNEERAKARNAGILMASGKYVTFLDSDDLLYKNHLSVARNLATEQNPTWFHLNYEILDIYGKRLKRARNRKGNLNKQLLTGNHLSCIGIFVTREILLSNLFDETPELIGSEDYELWLRLSKHNSLTYTNIVTSALVQHYQRSVQLFNSNLLIKRIEVLIEIVKSKRLIKESDQNIFLAHRYIYLALHLAIAKEVLKAIKYLWIAIRIYPLIFLDRKMLGVYKVLIVKNNPFQNYLFVKI